MAALTLLSDKHADVLFHLFAECIGKIGFELDPVIHCSSFKEWPLHEKEKPDRERKIVSRVKREMDEPRLSDSVRDGFGVQASPTVEKPATSSRRA